MGESPDSSIVLAGGDADTVMMQQVALTAKEKIQKSLADLANGVLEEATATLAPAEGEEPSDASPQDAIESRLQAWTKLQEMMVQVGLHDRAREYASSFSQLQEDTLEIVKRYTEALMLMDHMMSSVHSEIMQAHLITQMQVEAQQECVAQGTRIHSEVQAAHQAASAAVAGGPSGPRDLPRRPGMEVCMYYMKTGDCKYGASCKWDHPERQGPTQVPPPNTQVNAVSNNSKALTVKYKGDVPCDNLYITGLPSPQVSPVTLNLMFTQLGLTVKRSKIIPDTQGRGSSAALLQLNSQEEAAAAIVAWNGQCLPEEYAA